MLTAGYVETLDNDQIAHKPTDQLPSRKFETGYNKQRNRARMPRGGYF